MYDHQALIVSNLVNLRTKEDEPQSKAHQGSQNYYCVLQFAGPSTGNTSGQDFPFKLWEKQHWAQGVFQEFRGNGEKR